VVKLQWVPELNAGTLRSRYRLQSHGLECRPVTIQSAQGQRHWLRSSRAVVGFAASRPNWTSLAVS